MSRIIDAAALDFTALNAAVRAEEGDCEIVNCLGHRFIGDGLSDRRITVRGVPGNALGAYLNGAELEVFGNAQDAVGDTMNAGRIIIRGNAGDAAGYAMRGGAVYIEGSAGYRAGIHMKAYREKLPIMVIGGGAGSFLGEYQAGGLIIVLGLGVKRIVGNFPCTGMHGGRMLLRGDCSDVVFPRQVSVRAAGADDIDGIRGYVGEFCRLFGRDEDDVLSVGFTVITPDGVNADKQMYVHN